MPEVDPSQRPQAILAGLPLDLTSVAAIAQHLDLNKVPNALWGNFLLSIFGAPMAFNDIDFIIPDRDISAARTVLCNAGLQACVDQECYVVKCVIGSPPPDEHFHLGNNTPPYSHLRGDSYVSFHRQSRTLINVSDLGVSPTHASSEADIISASHPSLPKSRVGFGMGAFPPSLYPVRIPSPRCFTEACLLGFLREHDRTKDGDDLGHMRGDMSNISYELDFMGMVAYMVQYVYRTGQYSLDSLSPRFRDFVKDFMDDDVPYHVSRDILIASEKKERDSRDS